METAADFAIEKAKQYKPGVMNLTWGTFMQQTISGKKIENVSEKKTVAKKAATDAPKKITVRKAK